MLWVKAFHIISVICWFAAIFYLPRLFVYHALSDDQASRDRFKIMERKLYNGIATPSAIASVIFGAWLFYFNFDYFLSSGWMHVKLTAVAAVIAYHLMCGTFIKLFAEDSNKRSHRFYRVFNEVPVVLLILIVIMVIVRPF